MLSVGCRDRELRVATGFGFYPPGQPGRGGAEHAPCDSCAIQESLLGRGHQLCLLADLLGVELRQKEAERQEFTPQIRHTLLTLAEAAHGTRTAMTEKAGLGVGC
jgi:hypothetical protein